MKRSLDKNKENISEIIEKLRRVTTKYQFINMKALVVFTHPDQTKTSFNYAIFETVVESLRKSGAEVKTTDLSKGSLGQPINSSTFKQDPETVGFTAALYSGEFADEIIEEQSKVMWCTHLILVGPIMWGTLPPAAHSWLGKVFAARKMYDMRHLYENGYLVGKTAWIVATCGAPLGAYDPRSQQGSLDLRLYWLTNGLFWFCGMKVLRTQAFFGIADVNDDARKEWLRKLSVVVSKLDQRPAYEFHKTEEFTAGKLSKGLDPDWVRVGELGDLTIEESYSLLTSE